MSFSSSPIVESFPCSRFNSLTPSPTRTETDLPIEVDQSFNSSMSITESPYFSPTPNTQSKAMMISPAGSSSDMLSPISANLFGSKPKRPDPVPIQRSASGGVNAENPQELNGLGIKGLGGPRAFGRELSTNAVASRSQGLGMARVKSTSGVGKGMMLPPAVPDKSKRGGLPMIWTSSNEEMGGKLFQPALLRAETDPYALSPKSTSGESGMDIDSPANSSRKGSFGLAGTASPAFSAAGSFSGSPGLGSFFCDSPIAPPVQTGKRRSGVACSPASSSGSPSAKRTSLGSVAPRGFDKAISSGPMLFGSTNPRGNTLFSRRPQPYNKRPLLQPVTTSDESRTASFASADAVLYPSCQSNASSSSLPQSSGGGLQAFPRLGAAPIMRRAFSVCDQPAMPEMSEDESEFENSPSNPAGQGRPGTRRIGGSRLATNSSGLDGSPGCKPMRSSIAVPNCQASPSRPNGKGKKGSPFAGLPGFGDNEMDGKILPCHKVKEDGLVRITSQTLDGLISGQYSSKVKRYHILDCRFDYEYAGGHIAGAINVKSMDALDELLLQEATGVHEDGCKLPTPSRSGEFSDGEQVVLIFHCEFSAKRAPTFAKHLRSRDRTVNSALYPRIYYPEVYILEGGYCGFYQSVPIETGEEEAPADFQTRCDPQGYTPMDDPRHFERRNFDLHDFRKFSRTRSFTYGEAQAAASSKAAPPCPSLAFNAASAAQHRRHGGPTIDEGDEHNSSPSGPSGNESGIDVSPCPRVCSMGTAPIFGSAKTRTLGRVGMARNASYAGATFGR